MFYFQTLLNQALGSIDSTGMITAVVTVAYGILLVGFLIGLYQAAMSGGDVRALGITAIKYIVVAIVVANWSTIFHDVNNSFNAVAQFIGNNSGDVFLSWDKQLGQQFSDSSLSWWDIISGDIAALISVFLIVIAYILYIIAIVLFCFFYTLYGSVLYVLGPLVLAFLPMAGVGQISKAFATNVMIWNAWGIIYAIFGALITAIHMNQVSDGVGSFLGFIQGPTDSLLLGMMSIFYAVSIAIIPFIANRIISGDVGSAAASMVRTMANVAGIGVAAVSGAVAGAGAASAGSAGAGGGAAGASAGGGAGVSGGGGGSSSVAAGAASSTPPPTPSLGSSIRSGLVSAMSSGSGPGDSSGGTSESGGGPSQAGSTDGGAPTSSGSRGGGGRSSAGQSGRFGYRPQGLVQQLAFQGARAVTARSSSKSKQA